MCPAAGTGIEWALVWRRPNECVRHQVGGWDATAKSCWWAGGASGLVLLLPHEHCILFWFLFFFCRCLFCCVVKVILFSTMTSHFFEHLFKAGSAAMCNLPSASVQRQVVTNLKLYFDESQELMSCCQKHPSLSTFYSNSMTFRKYGFAASKTIFDVSKMVR